MTNIKLEIIKCLIEEENPLILSHIAKKLGKSVQSIDYHVKQLLEQNILHCAADNEDKKYYYLDLPFYDSKLIDESYGALTPIAQRITQSIDPAPKYKHTICILGYILQLFIDDASKEF